MLNEVFECYIKKMLSIYKICHVCMLICWLSCPLGILHLNFLELCIFSHFSPLPPPISESLLVVWFITINRLKVRINLISTSALHSSGGIWTLHRQVSSRNCAQHMPFLIMVFLVAVSNGMGLPATTHFCCQRILILGFL